MNCNLFEIKPYLLGQPVYSFFASLFFFFEKIRDQQQSQTKIAIQDIQKWSWGHNVAGEVGRLDSIELQLAGQWFLENKL